MKEEWLGSTRLSLFCDPIDRVLLKFKFRLRDWERVVAWTQDDSLVHTI